MLAIVDFRYRPNGTAHARLPVGQDRLSNAVRSEQRTFAVLTVCPSERRMAVRFVFEVDLLRVRMDGCRGKCLDLALIEVLTPVSSFCLISRSAFSQRVDDDSVTVTSVRSSIAPSLLQPDTICTYLQY